MSSVRPKLSWSEYIDYYLGCLQTGKFWISLYYRLRVINDILNPSPVFVTGLAMLTAPFRGENGNRSFSKHVKYAAVRHHLARCTAKQLQYADFQHDCICKDSNAYRFREHSHPQRTRHTWILPRPRELSHLAQFYLIMQKHIGLETRMLLRF